jgi:formylmethanofuran dehydrogenase subunit C
LKVPVEAKCIKPNEFSGKSIEEIAKLPIWEGNRKRALGELFKIKGESSVKPEECSIRIFGDLSRVRGIGAEMSMGEIIAEGNVGMRLGEEMKGGKILVKGDADSWVGSMMEAGTIEVMGDAGDYVGAPYRGSTAGMKGGMIIVHGNAGYEVGCFMKGGIIKIHGNVGQFVGIRMRDGTILVEGDSEGRVGAGMLEGKIILCGYVPSVLPTFTIDSIRPNVKVNEERVTGPFYRFVGDLADGGDGKLFISQVKNPHLNFYEKYL